MSKVNKSLYDIGSVNSNETISSKLMEFKRENLFIGIPARVVSTSDYESMQCLDVQPVINDLYPRNNDVVLEANTIKKVFVQLPSGGGFNIKLPVSKGDLVTLNYAHKDLGTFLDSSSDAQIDQSILKTANIEDCWITLGFGTRSNNQSPSAVNLVIEGKSTTITITPSGEVTCVTSGSSSIKSASHTIDAPTTTITGTLTVNESISSPVISADQSLTVENKEMNGHVHGGVERGTSNTDAV